MAVNVNDAFDIDRMIASHDWKYERVEAQRAGLYIHRSCSRCRADTSCLVICVDAPRLSRGN